MATKRTCLSNLQPQGAQPAKGPVAGCSEPSGRVPHHGGCSQAVMSKAGLQGRPVPESQDSSGSPLLLKDSLAKCLYTAWKILPEDPPFIGVRLAEQSDNSPSLPRSLPFPSQAFPLMKPSFTESPLPPVFGGPRPTPSAMKSLPGIPRMTSKQIKHVL